MLHGGANTSADMIIFVTLSVSAQLLCDFLTRALQKEPVLRPTARQLLQHPWLSITRSTVSEMSGKNHVAPMIADGRPPATIVNSVHDAGEDEDGDFLFDDGMQ